MCRVTARYSSISWSNIFFEENKLQSTSEKVDFLKTSRFQLYPVHNACSRFYAQLNWVQGPILNWSPHYVPRDLTLFFFS